MTDAATCDFWQMPTNHFWSFRCNPLVNAASSTARHLVLTLASTSSSASVACFRNTYIAFQYSPPSLDVRSTLSAISIIKRASFWTFPWYSATSSSFPSARQRTKVASQWSAFEVATASFFLSSCTFASTKTEHVRQHGANGIVTLRCRSRGTEHPHDRRLRCDGEIITPLWVKRASATQQWAERNDTNQG
jgi:hypothetical protein